MSSKTIGIISYFPDNKEIREARIRKLEALLNKCNSLFPNIKITIIAQNWKEYYPSNTKNLWIIDFDKPLGITEARRTLRRIFLDYCNTDYLIMLDDDCTLEGKSGEEYLKQIDDNPDCFIEFNKTLLKLFAISKNIFSQADYDNVSPEKGEGFEDRIFVNRLRKLFPNKRREFTNTGINEISVSTKDINSTWYDGQDLKAMLLNTQEIIEKI